VNQKDFPTPKISKTVLKKFYSVCEKMGGGGSQKFQKVFKNKFYPKLPYSEKIFEKVFSFDLAFFGYHTKKKECFFYS